MGNKNSSNSKKASAKYTDRWDISKTSQPLPTQKLKIPSKGDKNNKGRPCIIFYNGTFAPIHYGHIDALISAKHHLEGNGFNVLAGYLSPCWNGYCAEKMRRKEQKYISHFDRLNLINLAIKDVNWLMIDTNECFENKFYFPTYTIYNFYHRILSKTKLKKGTFDIVWLHGIDLGIAHIPISHKHFLRCLTVNNRLNDDANTKYIKEQIQNLNKQNDALLPTQMYIECDPLHLSSTKIRTLCIEQKYDELIDIFTKYKMEKVANYMIKHLIYAAKSIKVASYFEENELIGIFRQQLIEKGCAYLNKLHSILTPQTLTEYMHLSGTKWLKQNERICSFEYVKAGKNGFRATSFCLYDFIICTEDNKEIAENWKFFLKVSAQPMSRSNAWFQHNEYMFYKCLYSSYCPSFCHFPSLIFCDYVKNKEFEREINIICTEDVSQKVSFPFWFEPVSQNKMILIIRSLAEFHSKSFHNPCKNEHILSFVDGAYMKWIQCAMDSGYRMFKASHDSVQSVSDEQIEFMATIKDDLQCILVNKLYELAKEHNFLCLIHGDAVISNILLPENDEKEQRIEEKFGVVPWNCESNEIERSLFIDWQTFHIGVPYFDLISLFDLLLIDVGGEYEQKLFVCYMDFLMRFGVKLKGVNGLNDENGLKNYGAMFEYCRIWAFFAESGFWAGRFFQNIKILKSLKQDKKIKQTIKIQECVKKRLDHMMHFYINQKQTDQREQ